MREFVIFHQAGAIGVIAFTAAIVNGALGYGFSSITVPLALLFVANRTLNPALVLIEVALNGSVLWLNRGALPAVIRQILPIVVGLVPGVAIGTLLVSRVAPSWLRLGTFVVLLPLILVQAAGHRRPIRLRRSTSVAFGSGVGVLYAVTTISGPPLAAALNNQGFAKHEFRAALAFIRVAESSLTVVAYTLAGLFTSESLALVPQMLPGVAIGVPLGTMLIRHLQAETFRRVCMSFDAWVVSFGISTLLKSMGLVATDAAYLVMVSVIVLDAWLLARFFQHPRKDVVTHAA